MMDEDKEFQAVNFSSTPFSAKLMEMKTGARAKQNIIEMGANGDQWKAKLRLEDQTCLDRT